MDAGLAASGSEAACERRTVTVDELPSAIDQLREDESALGAGLSGPLKLAVPPLLDGLGPEAQSVGAVNIISRRGGVLIGWNTERGAFLDALDDAAIDPTGRVAVVLGTGGAARAVVDALREPASRVIVASSEPTRAAAVADRFHLEDAVGFNALEPVVRRADFLVNATPLGIERSSFPLDEAWFRPTHTVFDLLYNPPVTPLLKAARERGARAVNGLSMHLYQGIRAFEIWTGRPAPETVMRAALQQAVLGQLTG
jgi:shikimate dehydrogenase